MSFAISACSAGAVPLNGTCTMSMPAVCLKSSVVRWAAAPMPEEPKFSLPGFAFAYAMSSFTSFAGRLLFAVRMSGAMPASETGTRSLRGSNGSLP